MATYSSILAWRIPWTEEPGGLHSPWGCKQSDMTEQLTLPLLECSSMTPGGTNGLDTTIFTFHMRMKVGLVCGFI